MMLIVSLKTIFADLCAVSMVHKFMNSIKDIILFTYLNYLFYKRKKQNAQQTNFEIRALIPLRDTYQTTFEWMRGATS